MNLDIHTGIVTAFILALISVLILGWSAWRTFKTAMKLPYFRKRRVMLAHAWRLGFVGLFMAGISFLIIRFAEPVAFQVFPPSPTVTNTPTITLTPTVSQTPTITLTPTITNTPSITNTPAMPQIVETLFQSTTTPNPEVIFSPLIFAEDLDDNFQPVGQAEEFANPVNKIVAAFSYDQMTVGAQWSALWYRTGSSELVCVETLPWNGGTGGFGFSECLAPSGGWQAGEYEVQLFVGTLWKQSGRFTVTGDPPTPTITLTPTRTLTLTPTEGPSPTLPSPTPPPSLTPSRTPSPTLTLRPSPTPTITNTVRPTRTPRPTDTRRPTLTTAP